jgi:hypothetical protein
LRHLVSADVVALPDERRLSQVLCGDPAVDHRRSHDNNVVPACAIGGDA